MKSILLSMMVLAACNSVAPQSQTTCRATTQKTDVEQQREVFFRCMESIPAGGTQTAIGAPDWNKVVTECHKVSYDLARVDDNDNEDKQEKKEPEVTTTAAIANP